MIRLVSERTVKTCMLAAFCLSQVVFAQEQDSEPVYTETPSVQPPLLFIEVPIPFQPELDSVLPNALVQVDDENDPEVLLRLESIRSYNASVETIELNGGAWDQQLVQELAALGSLQQQQGSHLEAIETFNRAIHVNRIHSGLHTLDQIPAVESMIESHLATGEWEQADLYYSYLFYIQQKAFGPNDPRMIPVLDRLGNWNIQAFNIGFGESLGLRLSTAQILFNAAARMVGVHFGENDERFIKYRYNIANSAYLVSRNPQLMAEVDRVEYRNSQDMLRDKLNEKGFNNRPRGFQAGEVALREIVQHYATRVDADFELANALANLGDWYLMFGRRNTAEDLYLQAWGILSGLENGEELNHQLFGHVVPIPTFANSVDNLLTQPLTTSEGKTLNFEYVDVVFDVTETGDIRNVEILSETTEANSNQLSRLRREIRNSYFRPKLEDGKSVRTELNYFRYKYWY